MNKEFLQNLREQIKAGTVTEQEPMNKHTSFAIGGPADCFCSAGNKGRNQKCGLLCKRSGDSFFCYGQWK